MDYFIENGIDRDTVNFVYGELSEDKIFSLEYNRKNVVDIYNYLKSIGITENSIKELLISNTDLFIIDLSNIKDKLDKCKNTEIIELINSNVDLINQII